MQAAIALWTDGLDTRWRRWAAGSTLAALVIGIALYPNVHLGTMALGPALVMALAGTAAVLLFRRPRLIVLVPLVTAYLPSQQIGFVSYLIALAVLLPLAAARRLARPLDALDWALLAMLLLAFVSWLANLGPETDVWSLPVFILTFLTPWLLFFLARALEWTRRDLELLAGAWLALALSQVVVALVKPLVLGTPEAYAVPLLLLEVARFAVLDVLSAGNAADLTFGSTRSAHHLGVAMLLLTAFLVALAVAARRPRWCWGAVLSLFVFLMTDSKHAILAALLPAAWYGAVVLWPMLDVGWRRRLAAAGIVVGTVVVVGAGARIANLVVSGLWRPYVTLATINPKAQLMMRTASRMAEGNLQTWVGYGPGSFASRAATIRASEVLYKKGEAATFVPPHTGDSYREVAHDLYTSEIALTTGYRSGALTNPFSSVVGIVAEFGIIGTAAVLALLAAASRLAFSSWRAAALPAAWRAAGAAAGFGVPLLLFLGIFDSYFEQPDVTAVLVTLLIVAAAAPGVAAGDGSA
ncbi:MAG TPA: hypothetical protein VFS94_03815 [Gemmatimonadales bacterium]|nr:hypothetical protein [Gemmatimonadales bacterium]